MSALTRRKAALPLVPALLLAAACGGGELPAGRAGDPVKLDGATVTLVDGSGSPAYVEWSVSATEDGASCPAPGEVYVDQGDGDHVQLDQATDWSCTVLQAGETGRVRLPARRRQRAAARRPDRRVARRQQSQGDLDAALT